MDEISDALYHKDFVNAFIHASYSCYYVISRSDFQFAFIMIIAFYMIFVRKIVKDSLKEGYILRPNVSAEEPYFGDECLPVKFKIENTSGWFSRNLIRWTKDTYFQNNRILFLMKALKLDIFKGLILPEYPTFIPLGDDGHRPCENDMTMEDEKLTGLIREGSDSNDSEFNFLSISELHSLYREGKKTPESVMKTLIKYLKEADEQNLPLKAFIEYNESDIIEQAVASTKRWMEGNILSFFDGIPVGIKDQFIVGKHPCRCGLPFEVKREDISSEKGLVKKLREGGAILIGITNMDQVGLGVYGINLSKYHGICRNPYNPLYSSGGSSSGSASAVASGLSVFALGTDGGGSIRIPAAHCGIVGLKATYGSYSMEGLKGYSNACTHTGALCSSIRDAAITFGFLAGDNAYNAVSSIQSYLLGEVDDINLRGLRIGVDKLWMEDASPEIRLSCVNTLRCLEERFDVEVVNIHIPEKLEMTRAHIVSFIGEQICNNRILLDHHYDINLTTQLLLQIGQHIDAHDYIQAAKQRTRMTNALKYIFNQVDVILSPGFNCFQPEITSVVEEYGCGDLNVALKICSLHQLGNLTGVPAMTLPVGYTEENLPMAVQLISSWWREDLLLKVGYAIEKCVKKNPPRVHFDIKQ